MIAKITPTTYVDIEKVVYIDGIYDSPNPEKWVTMISFGGEPVRFPGQMGKIIHEAYEWRVRGHATCMIKDAPNYKKLV